MRAGLDAGLADGYWRQYFTDSEVAELEAAIRTTGVVFKDTPVHVRVYHSDDAAPTIVAPHGLIVYGILCARLHLQFHRAGWNVVSWDLPGFGQSGGRRNGPTIGSMIEVWRMMIDWAAEQYGGRPVYMVGLAEDGVTGYYAAANNPNVQAISCHHLLEFGNLENVGWVNPMWKRRLQGMGLAVLEKVAPWVQFDAEKSVPWEAIFGSEEDQAAYAIYRKDPLRIERYNVHLARDLFRPRKPPVSFEDCRTPVQLITSLRNNIWPPGTNDKTYARLGCEKEHVEMDADQWSVSEAFNAEYAGLVLKWFEKVGDRVSEVLA
ncbi:MAG TPA: alpha/beta hydrolase [Gaiellaceae bacterium]|nr:alpha/beta hydrolase [Gaiellaceae bacterium]